MSEAPGSQERRPEDGGWAVGAAVRALPQDACPSALALTGTIENLIPLDGSGAPVRPALLYSDSRAEPLLRANRARLDALSAGRITGNVPEPMTTLCKLLLLREREPSAFTRVRPAPSGAKTGNATGRRRLCHNR